MTERTKGIVLYWLVLAAGAALAVAIDNTVLAFVIGSGAATLANGLRARLGGKP